MRMAAENGGVRLQAKEGQGLPATPRSWKRQGRIVP